MNNICEDLQDNDVYIPFTISGKMKDNEIFPELYSKILAL